MGQPVKIVDLARNLVLLSGLRPDQDIKIEFTGIRPGEKLYEELNTMLEDTAPTTHEKIRIFVGNCLPPVDMLGWLDHLREVCKLRDNGGLVVALKEIVPDYSPSAHLLKRVIEPRVRYNEPKTVGGETVSADLVAMNQAISGGNSVRRGTVAARFSSSVK